ncbi:hypothetical protein [uncultured Paraglaciecola sp.]|uniref:hypothetical protein n=1 Tax=uncultured Paraglaciecola sp. TaxID=1765024 RepID=UPI0026102168|nr:hypothetical protein [uncultured Paraglaciecola sp.]
MNILSDNTIAYDVIVALEKRVVDLGGWLSDELSVVCREGELSLSAPNDAKSMMIPIEACAPANSWKEDSEFLQLYTALGKQIDHPDFIFSRAWSGYFVPFLAFGNHNSTRKMPCNDAKFIWAYGGEYDYSISAKCFDRMMSIR